MQLSNYDRRQLGRMLDAIDRFEGGDLAIDALIGSIDALTAVLETRDVAFKSSLRKQWGVLENVYASALDKGRIPFGGNDRDLIQPALAELRKMVSADALSEDE